MSLRNVPFLLGLLIAGSAAATSWAQDIVITEFMALNGSSLADEDGDFSDWIEIYNRGISPVSLAGWALTDDALDAAKWVFPDKEMAPGDFLIVFASSKDRRDPESELHTNFRLTSAGELLGLVAPGGNLVQAFGQGFPEQVANSSYGVAMETSVRALVGAGAPALYFVPQDGALGLSWTEPGFDDGDWAGGATGIGYDRKETPTYEEMIGTDVGDDMQNVNASIYIRIPFQIAPGDTIRRLQLQVRYDDGFVAYLNGVEIARRNTLTTIRYNSRARLRRPEEEALVFEQIPVSDPGLLREGDNVLAIQALNDTSRSPDLLMLPLLESLEIVSVDPDTQQYFALPTPGWPNTHGEAGVAQEPVFSRPGGAFQGPLSVELSVDAENAVIHYTTDGSEPTATSPVYDSPIDVSATLSLKARTFQAGMIPSRMVSEVYFVLHSTTANFNSNLPIMIIETRTNPNSDTFVPFSFGVIDNDQGRNTLSAPFAFSGRGGIKLRGSSSLGFPKNNFTLEIQDDFGDDKSVPLMGLPPESDWVLHGPYSDKSLMRNALAYQWSDEIGWFAPRTCFLELYYKRGGTAVASSHYWGVYLLVEKIKRDRARVAIQRLLPTDNAEPEITGGYIFKKDRLDPGDAGFRTPRMGQHLGYVEPKEREMTPQQRTWVRNFFGQFETALYGGNFRDPQEGYAKYIDVPSWVDHHIVVETCKQIDGFRLSTYMFKDRGGKLKMGPVWDYNLSLGNADYLNGWNPTGWYYLLINSEQYPWYPRIFQDPAFVEAYRQRWMELRAGLFATRRLQSTIDQYVDLLRESQARNFQKWRVLGIRVWPNWFIARTWDEEIDWMRNDWLPRRLEWFDSQFIRPPEFEHPGGPVSDGFQARITTTNGTVFYTLNGPDPKNEDGSTAEEAIEYSEPITINGNIRVRARARIGSGVWSGLVEATYVTDVLPLVVTEIMYNPPEDDDPNTNYSPTDFEFIEVKNTGDEPVSLSGVRFTDRLRFNFDDGDIASVEPGKHVVVVKNTNAFASRYGSDRVSVVAGEFVGILSNRRQTISLQGPLGEPLMLFNYEDAWHPSTDGEGYSLVIRDPDAPRESWGEAASWRASLAVGGSPGQDDVPEGLQVPGDIDQNARLNVTDAVRLLGHLAWGWEGGPCDSDEGNTELLDLNRDRRLNLSDAVYLLNFLFLEGEAPLLGVECVPIEGCPRACGSN